MIDDLFGKAVLELSHYIILSSKVVISKFTLLFLNE